MITLPAETLAVAEALKSSAQTAKTQVAVSAKQKQSGSMAKSFVIGSSTEPVIESTISKFRTRQQKQQQKVVSVSKLLPKRKAGKKKKVDESVMDAYVKSFFNKPLVACSMIEYAWAKSMCGM